MRRLVLLGHVELPVALESLTRGERLPDHVKSVQAEGIRQVKLIDASPIGINIRSTVATYANIHDELRKVFARTPGARESGCKAGDFSYNTGSLRCPVCDGTGSISLDVQFLPDVDIPCPDCHGSRYARKAFDICRKGVSLPALMAMSVDEALAACADLGLVRDRLPHAAPHLPAVTVFSLNLQSLTHPLEEHPCKTTLKYAGLRPIT